MRSIQFDPTNEIVLDGVRTGFKVTQNKTGTTVYTPEVSQKKQAYKEHKMPHVRYSLAHETPSTGIPGVIDFERDFRNLLKSFTLENTTN